MSLIKDVANEIKALDISAKSIKKFGLVVGGVFAVLGALLIWKDVWHSTRIVFLVAGIILIVGALVRSKSEEMKIVYRIWMGIAFFLGWIMSRVILSILFYFVLAPIGFMAKIFGKQFLDLTFKSGKTSYWIPKEKKQTDYEKMF
ncbi:MAG: SxtJ family membrane protein [Melioribacteraceae bacterium]